MSPSFDDLVAASALVRRAVKAGRLTAAAGRNVRTWLIGKGYVEFLPELLSLIHTGQFNELERCFWEIIPFGTGGRRGPMAPLGSATINTRTVAESACGLGKYLLSVGLAGGRVAIACDTRNRSLEFSRLAATVLAAQGFHVRLFESPRATPELSFAVRELQCAAGIMISASHNPPADNGVKVYWSNGGQVLPPHDKGILSAVTQVEEIPLVDFDAALQQGSIAWIPPCLDDAYVGAVKRQSLSSARDVSVLFTPLHGVGETSVARVLERSGFRNVEIFEPHRKPDGDFPNVPQHLANPELPSVFDGPRLRARETGADLILASDPDADRLGVMVRHPAPSTHYEYLSGNRLGAILVDFVLRRNGAGGALSPRQMVVTTLVTTPLIGRIARAAGVHVVDDLLVGFKYVAQTMDQLGADRLIFACEESLGYLAGGYVRDKDAALAALLVCECAAELRAEGRTLVDQLQTIHQQHGYVAEIQQSVTRRGPQGQAQIREMMDRLRAAPPTELAGVRLTSVRDYGRHEVRRLPDNVSTAPLPEPQSDLLVLESHEDGGDLTLAVRPSGTEPKAKSYLFLRTSLEPTVAEAQAQSVMDAFWQWAKG